METNQTPKPYKPGDKWSPDFDYVGLIKAVFFLTQFSSDKANWTRSTKVNRIQDSLESVNLHTLNDCLGRYLRALRLHEENKMSFTELLGRKAELLTQLTIECSDLEGIDIRTLNRK